MEHVSHVEPHIAWNADSLRELLGGDAYVDDVVVMANAQPFGHYSAGDGIEVRHSTSGLVTAVEPLIRATSGVWIAHGSGSADREMVERNDGLDVPPRAPRYRLRRIWLTEGEIRRYYDGFANGGLWPLCHRTHVPPVFRTEDFNTYWEVNRRFVEALCEEARSEAPLVLVQDYHLGLAPMMIRASLPWSTIVAFWHIPWPPAQVFESCPWSRQLIEGLLAADIVGFQTPDDCRTFMDTAERVLDRPLRQDGRTLVHHGHRIEVQAYPTSIQWPNEWSAGLPSVEECRRQVGEELRLSPSARVSVSAGRLDYAKGIEETFVAVERLMESHPEYQAQLTHVQIAAPSRTSVPAYRELGDRVRVAAARINHRFGADDYQPIVLLDRSCTPSEVYRVLRAADVCYVGSLHDGMNLVAKEFVAARDDGRGVLVLSEFAGASWQLTDALVVNPYDVDGVATNFHRALTMGEVEQRARMARLRQVVTDESAHTWAGQILSDAVRVRPMRPVGVAKSRWSA